MAESQAVAAFDEGDSSPLVSTLFDSSALVMDLDEDEEMI